jgi:hypothetical protein
MVWARRHKKVEPSLKIATQRLVVVSTDMVDTRSGVKEIKSSKFSFGRTQQDLAHGGGRNASNKRFALPFRVMLPFW